jgi:streptomycin 6-kinase
LHSSGLADPSHPQLTQRVEHLFTSGAAPYTRNPQLLDVVPRGLYERGHALATRLTASVEPTGLLHGDLTPSNILDGGSQRGLVAIDPAPCLGDDLAFDAIDLVLWQATDLDTIEGRTRQLAPAIGTTSDRLLQWCTAFAAMTALELAEIPTRPAARLEAYLELAARAES